MTRFFLLITLAFTLSACQNSPEKPVTTEFTGARMTMPFRLIVGQDLSEPERETIKSAMENVFNETDRIYNKWNPESELSQLNRLAAGETVSISRELEQLLLFTHDLVELTEGRFDPTIEPLQQAWKKRLEVGELPTEKELAEVTASIGWHHVHIGPGTFMKDNDQTMLDLGGIAKGLCVDRMVEALNRMGYDDVYFEWGGEIRAAGQHPENRPWTVFISHLGSHDLANAIDTVALSNQSVATSGDYMQYWTVNDEENSTYFHILDPRTQKPLQIKPDSIASVTIKASNCMIADALATAAMIFETKGEAEEWISQIQAKIPSLDSWIVIRDAAISSSPEERPVSST